MHQSLVIFFCSMLFANAFAAGPTGVGMGMLNIIPFLLIFVVMYLFMIRPQQKRNAEHKNMLNELKAGDNVITAGGVVGKIVKVTDRFFTLEISEGVVITILKSSISSRSQENQSISKEIVYKKENDKKKVNNNLKKKKV